MSEMDKQEQTNAADLGVKVAIALRRLEHIDIVFVLKLPVVVLDGLELHDGGCIAKVSQAKSSGAWEEVTNHESRSMRW
jgi:hypothetical protein